MPRPRKFDEATVKIALRDVFWENGYDGTSYADIMSATGLNKGSLYASFGDKRALYQHAISGYDQTIISSGVKMLRDGTVTPAARMEGFFTLLVDAAQTAEGRWGCLLCNAAIDQAPFDKDVETVVSASLTRLRNAINYCVKETALSDKTDLIWTAYFGGHVMVKAGYSKAMLEQTRAQVLSLF